MANSNWPTMTFEVCFNQDPFDPSPPAAVWTSLTGRVVAWQHQAPSGRQYELARTEAASIGVLVDNQDGALDPSNTGGPFWPNVLPYRQWRVRSAWTPSNQLTGDMANFEGGIGTWAADTNATVARSTTHAHSGAASLRLSSVAAGDMAAAHNPTGSSGIPVTAGQQVVAWAWFTSQVSSRTVQMAINWFDAGGVFLSTSFGPSQTDNANWWTLATIDATAPASAAKAKVRVKVLGTFAAGETHYIDDVGFGLGSSYPLVGGYVERWPQQWDRHKAWVPLIVVDVLALLEPKTFRSCYDEEVLADQPVAYYPLSEPASATTFGSIATTQQPAATIVSSKYGAGTLTPGTASILPADPATCVQLAGGTAGPSGPGSAVQLGQAGAGPFIGGAGPFSAELWFQRTGNPGWTMVLFEQIEGNRGGSLIVDYFVTLDTAGKLHTLIGNAGHTALVDTATSGAYADGKPHHVLYTWAVSGGVTTTTLYVDGAQVLSGFVNGTFALDSSGWLLVGGLVTSLYQQSFYNGLVAHVAIYNVALSSAQASAHYQAGNTAFAGELSGARYTRILRYAAYQGPSAVDTGQSQMAAASLTGQGATQALQDVVVAENGNQYVAGDGTLTFKQRSARWNTVSVATVGELESPYLGDISFDFDPTFLYTRVEVTRPGGVTVAAFDAAAQKRYGTRVLPPETPQILLDLEAQDRANYQLAQYKDPKERLPQVTLDPASNPALWPLVLGTRIGDRWTAKRRPFGAPVKTIDVFVEAVSHDVDFRADHDPHWRTTYLLSPAGATFQFWKLDDATFGKLDSGNLVAYSWLPWPLLLPLLPFPHPLPLAGLALAVALFAQPRVRRVVGVALRAVRLRAMHPRRA